MVGNVEHYLALKRSLGFGNGMLRKIIIATAGHILEGLVVGSAVVVFTSEGVGV
jgi:hypothetical protein